MISYEKINNWNLLRIIWVKMIFYPVISLCPALYCVQLYTVYNTLLCPAHYCVQQNTVSTLTQRVFCSPSHFNVLQSYHAALAKHLSYICYHYQISSIIQFIIKSQGKLPIIVFISFQVRSFNNKDFFKQSRNFLFWWKLY